MQILLTKPDTFRLSDQQDAHATFAFLNDENHLGGFSKGPWHLLLMQ